MSINHPILPASVPSSHVIRREERSAIWIDQEPDNPLAIFIKKDRDPADRPWDVQRDYQCLLMIGKPEIKAAIEALIAAYEAIP